MRRSVEFSSATARCTPWRVEGHNNGETSRHEKKPGNVDPSECENGSEEDVTRKPVAH